MLAVRHSQFKLLYVQMFKCWNVQTLSKREPRTHFCSYHSQHLSSNICVPMCNDQLHPNLFKCAASYLPQKLMLKRAESLTISNPLYMALALSFRSHRQRSDVLRGEAWQWYAVEISQWFWWLVCFFWEHWWSTKCHKSVTEFARSYSWPVRIWPLGSFNILFDFRRK